MNEKISTLIQNQDRKMLTVELKTYYGVKKIAGEVISYFMQKEKIAGVYSIDTFGQCWQNVFTYKKLFGRFDESIFPAILIGGSGYGVDFYLHIETGKVISLHHDATFYEKAADIQTESKEEFTAEFVKQGAVFTIGKLLALQNVSAELKTDDILFGVHFYKAAANALGWTLNRLAKNIYNNSLECVYVLCCELLENGIENLLLAENKRVSAAKRSDAKYIDLSFCFLNKLPVWLSDCKNLTELDLDGNLLHGTEDLFALLVGIEIQTLSISECGLKSIPVLPKTVNKLDISNNPVHDITSLLLLHDLQSIDLSNTLIEEEAVKMLKQAFPLCKIQLRTKNSDKNILDCSFQDLKKLPASIKQRIGIEEVILTGNPHLDFNEVFELLSTLKIRKLVLNQCSLSELPASVSKLENLEHIVITGEWNYGDSDLKNQLNKKQLLQSLTPLTGLKNIDISQNDGLLKDYAALYSNFTKLESLIVEYDAYDDNAKDLADFFKILSVLPNFTTLELKGDAEHDLKSISVLAPILKHLYLKFQSADSIPKGVSLLENLETLYFYGCLQKMDSSIGDMKKLRELTIEKNSTGHFYLPDSFCNLESLEKLQINSYQLFNLPADFGKLTNLVELELRDASLNELPHSFGDLKNLIKLDLSENALKTLPESFAKLKNLEVLNLGDNGVFSELPHSFGKLSALKELNLSGCNRLTKLPATFAELNLRSISLYSPYPEEYLDYDEVFAILPNFKELENLNIVNFKKSDYVIPDSFQKLISLKTLRVCIGKDNKGSMFRQIAKLLNLEKLDLFQKEFDLLPDEFGDLPNLKEIRIDFSKIPASSWNKITQVLGKLPELKKLDCNWTSIDAVPENIHLLKNLEVLDLCQNRISQLPASIVEMTNLRLLDIRLNRIPDVKIKRLKKQMDWCEVLE